MRTKIRELKSNPKKFIGTDVNIKGWVRTQRNQKTFSFIEVNDGSTLSNFQVIAEPSLTNYDTLMNQATTGASVSIVGTIVESPASGQPIEMKVKSMEVLGL